MEDTSPVESIVNTQVMSPAAPKAAPLYAGEGVQYPGGASSHLPTHAYTLIH